MLNVGKSMQVGLGNTARSTITRRGLSNLVNSIQGTGRQELAIHTLQSLNNLRFLAEEGHKFEGSPTSMNNMKRRALAGSLSGRAAGQEPTASRTVIVPIVHAELEGPIKRPSDTALALKYRLLATLDHHEPNGASTPPGA